MEKYQQMATVKLLLENALQLDAFINKIISEMETSLTENKVSLLLYLKELGNIAFNNDTALDVFLEQEEILKLIDPQRIQEMLTIRKNRKLQIQNIEEQFSANRRSFL